MRSFLVALLALCCHLLAAQPMLDSRHLLVDGTLSGTQAAQQPHTYTTLQEAVAHLQDSTTIFFKPYVYWVDNPDTPAVAVGKNGREPFGMVIKARFLRLVGLSNDASHVVLASQRGQTQGAVGNFTMFDFHVDDLQVENLTMGNYCNVDLDYALRPELSRKKRAEAITQAHVGYVHGRQLLARNVRFVSRLNLNPLNGAQHSYYENCHFECTDDALNGRATYRHCDFDFYGSKPFWSTFGAGALFIDCDFYVRSHNREMFFCKQGGPVAVVDCRYHAPEDIYLGWTAYPQPWLRCYQQNFTLNGKPYVIGHRQTENTIMLHDFHGEEPPFLTIDRHEATLRTGTSQPLTLTVSHADGQPISWRVPAEDAHAMRLSATQGESVTVTPTNEQQAPVSFCLVASTPDGRETACYLTIEPSQLPPPTFVKLPRLSIKKGRAMLRYQLNSDGKYDDRSAIAWYRCTDQQGSNAVKVAQGTREYRLTQADAGYYLAATVTPRHARSDFGEPQTCRSTYSIYTRAINHERFLDTDFSTLPLETQRRVMPGFWTIDGYKPADTAEFPWSFDDSKPMWTYGEGFNGAVGQGLLQAQRGARLMYTPVETTCGDMSLVLQVDPTKTAGQGFGSATGQYMDVCLKFDTRTLTGYGLRIIRTTKHAKAVDFLLVAYRNGKVEALTAPVSATCYRTGCTIALRYAAGKLSADVTTETPKPADSVLPHEVHLQASVPLNPFGGVHIQHTGSCGESTTMLHHLRVDWH